MAGDRRAEAAAVRAMARGSQHNTIKAMSQRIARSESVSTPISSATYLIGAERDRGLVCTYDR
jgi:hypothetical protein